MSLVSKKASGASSDSKNSSILPKQDEMRAWLHSRYGDVGKHGWRVQLQWKRGYVSPESWYEAVVDKLVTKRTNWIDVGGGKTVFPDNEDLTHSLAKRCNTLVGVDPSDNIEANPFVHERAKCTIEEYHSDRSFDLATLRMVVEHIQTPSLAIASLARLLSVGGKVVVYTPNRWSVASMAALMIPQSFHSRISNYLWETRDEDVFPTVYRMNTRKQLRTLFEAGGFREVAFALLDSCSITQRFQIVYSTELIIWRALRLVQLPYPENNLLGVYEKV